MDYIGHRSTLVSNLYNQAKEGKYTDITFDVGGHLFHAHKCVLAGGSEYFRTMFNGRWTAVDTSSVIKIEEDPVKFERTLEIIYMGNESKAEYIGVDPLLNYFQVYGYDKNQFIRTPPPINSTSLYNYFEALEQVFPDGIPDPIFTSITEAITLEHDISELSDAIIIRLYKSHKYVSKITNIVDTFELITAFVSVGHSEELFGLFNYKLFPPVYVKTISSNVISKMNGSLASLPQLDKDFKDENYTDCSFYEYDELQRPYLSHGLLVVEQETMGIMNGNGKIYPYSFDTDTEVEVRLGDIIKDVYLVIVPNKYPKIADRVISVIIR